MSEPVGRMTDRDSSPTPQELESWLGKTAFRFWQQVEKMIADAYPGVFAPEWLYGGQKHGWSLRYKKSKSFCTLVPERKFCRLLIVFGAEERAKVDDIRRELSARVRKAYDDATTYHDGKWLFIEVDTKATLADIARLLATKRKPKVTCK